ncbi:MAG: S41 family peptidase, partial [Anaerolineales bacterium]
NMGGEQSIASAFLAYFTNGKLGDFVDRYNHKRPWVINGVDKAGSQYKPLVVLVGKDTYSFGELCAGVLKDRGRAYLMGETSEGNVELLWGYPFKDGSLLLLAHERFVPLYHPDWDWEKSGIIPDLTIPPQNWGDITLNNDLALEVAYVYFDTH